MKTLINGESLKELRALDNEFSSSITARLNAAGVMLDDVLWVADTLLNRSNYVKPYLKNSSVRQLARLNKVPVTMRLAALQNVLSGLWRDYARSYNSIVAQGVLCSTQGAWDVFKSLRKKFKRGKPFAFNVGGVRVHSEEKDTLRIAYGDNLKRELVFDRRGDRFYVRMFSTFGEHKKAEVWLNTKTGRAEYTKDGLFQDILNLVQSPVWEPEGLPTHVCFEMLPTAFITSVLMLPLESTPDELGADKLFDLCRTARRAANGNA